MVGSSVIKAGGVADSLEQWVGGEFHVQVDGTGLGDEGLAALAQHEGMDIAGGQPLQQALASFARMIGGDRSAQLATVVDDDSVKSASAGP